MIKWQALSKFKRKKENPWIPVLSSSHDDIIHSKSWSYIIEKYRSSWASPYSWCRGLMVTRLLLGNLSPNKDSFESPKERLGELNVVLKKMYGLSRKCMASGFSFSRMEYPVFYSICLRSECAFWWEYHFIHQYTVTESSITWYTKCLCWSRMGLGEGKLSL